SHQHDEFAVVDEDIDAVDDLDRSKGLSDVADRDRSHGTPPVTRPLPGAPLERARGLFSHCARTPVPQWRARRRACDWTGLYRQFQFPPPYKCTCSARENPGFLRKFRRDPGAAVVCYQRHGSRLNGNRRKQGSMPPLIRRATAEDTARIGAIARAAYAKYVPRIGREPAPMVADFAAEVAAGRVVVIATAGGGDGYMIARAQAGGPPLP